MEKVKPISSAALRRRSSASRAAFLLAVSLMALAASGRAAAQADSAAGAKAETKAERGAASSVKDKDDAADRAAIEKGLTYLAKHQTDTGAIGRRYVVATTALSGLAFLGAGHRYGEGRNRDAVHRDVLQNAVQFLLQSADSKGYLSEGDSRMHGHCYAMLFLTQIYGELPSNESSSVQRDVKRAIEAGLRVIRDSQTRQGGWYYTPENPERQDEASITICALQALRAANDSGFLVPKRTIDGAVDYVKRCKAEDGSFRYSLRGGDDHTSYSLTVAAVSTLHAAGQYDAPEIAAGLDFARKRLSEHVREPMKAAEKEFFFYANLYAAQAFYQAGGTLWASWHPAARQYLLDKQEDDGSWADDHGAEFGTAVALLILELPLNYLPIFQR